MGVSISSNENNYTFSVSISSPNKDCEQYANWWEIISEDDDLIYRRILGHSNVTEHPFIRSGGIVPIAANQTVIIRAHMNTSGYGATIYRGSVLNGFSEDTIASEFASDLALQQPLHNNCVF